MPLKIGNWIQDVGGKKVVLGLGAVVLAPVVLPAVAKASRPLAKAAIKTGIRAYEKGRVIFAEAGEVFEDVMSEAQVEIAEEESARTVDVTPPSGESE